MRRFCSIWFLVLGLGVGSAFHAASQTYDLSWFVVAGGGGTSTGATYTVSGTIGQSDAGQMSGGNYTLTGGFWSLFAATQTPGAPTLNITVSNLNAIISWPSSSTGFTLQQNSSVGAPANWTTNGLPAVVVANGLNTVTLPASGGPRYFRLKQ